MLKLFTVVLAGQKHQSKDNLTLAGTRHFAILDGTTGVNGATPLPLGVSNVSIEELSGKNQWITLDEYSLLVVRFLTVRQNLTQL